jgi:hypothetical protein
MRIPVIETTAAKPERHGRPKYADCRPLPASCMSEYSVLGLVIGGLDRAVEILSAKGLHLSREKFGAELEIFGLDQLPDIVEMLAGAGVYGSIGDVIDSVYQG